MHVTVPAVDHTVDLRREINALHGLLQFSVERRYPEEITLNLRQMLSGRERALSDREKDPSA